MRGQTVIVDIFMVALYYLVLWHAWTPLMNEAIKPTLQGTDWEWVLPIVEIIALVGPIFYLLYKMNAIQLAMQVGLLRRPPEGGMEG